MSPTVLAGCVIVRAGRLLLLCRRSTGWLELPGGKVADGEDIEAAAVRELREELCCQVAIVQKLGEAGFKENGKRYHYIWFLAKLLPNEVLQLGEPERFSSFEWVTIENLEGQKLSFNMENFFKSLQKGGIKL